jgi:hypothetical protein
MTTFVGMSGRARRSFAWYRKLIAKKFDGSKQRRYPGRPAIAAKLEGLIVKMASENSGWAYDLIVRLITELSNQLGMG